MLSTELNNILQFAATDFIFFKMVVLTSSFPPFPCFVAFSEKVSTTGAVSTTGYFTLELICFALCHPNSYCNYLLSIVILKFLPVFVIWLREKLGEHRRTLQQGLEVIRGIGNHGMEVQLVIHLAHTFASKADTLDKVIFPPLLDSLK